MKRTTVTLALSLLMAWVAMAQHYPCYQDINRTNDTVCVIWSQKLLPHGLITRVNNINHVDSHVELDAMDTTNNRLTGDFIVDPKVDTLAGLVEDSVRICGKLQMMREFNLDKVMRIRVVSDGKWLLNCYRTINLSNFSPDLTEEVILKTEYYSLLGQRFETPPINQIIIRVDYTTKGVKTSKEYRTE